MSEIGPFLKKARIEKNLTLEDLQHITKIRKSYLEAIEENNYKFLPGTFYVKAFIKSYADAVNITPVELMRIYEQTNKLEDIEMPPKEQIRQKKSLNLINIERMNKWIRNSVIISFIALIIIVVYYFYSKNYLGISESKIVDNQQLTSITEKATQSTSTPVLSDSPTPTATPKPSPKANVVFVKNEYGVDIYEVTNANQLNLSFEIIGEKCWIQVDEIDLTNKKNLQKQQVYLKGDKDQFTLFSSAYLNIGLASAVKLLINESEISFGDYNNPKRIQLNLQKKE